MGIRPDRGPTAIRTADVFALVTREPVRIRDIAEQLGVMSTQLGGHIESLKKQGKIVRIARGYVQLSDFGMQRQEAA